jgi:hypothetical protein
MTESIANAEQNNLLALNAAIEAAFRASRLFSLFYITNYVIDVANSCDLP